MVDDKDIDRLKEIFVTRQECQETTDGIRQHEADIDTKLAVVEQQNKLQLWILGLEAASIIAWLVAKLIGA